MRKVENHHNLYKGNHGVVVNTDLSTYEKAKERKREKQRINEMEDRMIRIEQMLERLINGKG